MGNRIFTTLIIFAWIVSTGWLLITKVFPPMSRGTPPPKAYSQISKTEAAIWGIKWKQRSIGWNVTKVIPKSSGRVQWYSRLKIKNVTIQEIVKEIVGGIANFILKDATSGELLKKLNVESTSFLEFNEMGNLEKFDCNIHFDSSKSKSAKSDIQISGKIKGSEINVKLRAGEESFSDTRAFPDSFALSSQVNIRTHLPNLKYAQQWKEEIYNPLMIFGTQSVSIINAKVEQDVMYDWNGKQVKCWIVVYREDSSDGISSDENIIQKIWVLRDGQVIRQETKYGNAKFNFERLTDQQAKPILNQLNKDWNASVDKSITEILNK